MIQTLVAILMWVLVGSLLILRRGRPDRNITYASVTIATAMTLNVDAIYLAVDRVLGGTNIATLVSDVLLMIGLFFLGRAAMKAGEYRPWLVRAAVGRPALLLAVAANVVVFFFIDRGTSTTDFMLDLGDQPAAAIYSMLGFMYCGIVLAAMLALAVRRFRAGVGIQRVPAGLLVIGSVLGLVLCLDVLTMDVAHVGGQLDLMRALGLAYGPLSLFTFLFLCAGFSGQPIVRMLRDRARREETMRISADLEPLWRRATTMRPGLSSTDALGDSFDDPEVRLHREVVEIRDAMIDPRVSFTISAREQESLERAEQHLLGQESADIATYPRDDGAVVRGGEW